MTQARSGSVRIAIVAMTMIGGGVFAADFETELSEGWAVFHRGDYVEADGLATALMERAEREYGPVSSELADAIDLAVQCRARGPRRRDPGTLPLAERVVEIRKALTGRDGKTFATSLHALGVMHNLWGRNEDSERLLLEAFRLRQRLLEETDPDFVLTLIRLGDLMVDLVRMDEAKAYHERAVSLGTSLPAEEFVHSESLNRYAYYLYTAGKFEEARDRYQQALGARLKAKSPDHPMTATLQHNLGIVKTMLGEVAAAKALHEQAGTTRKRRLGDHRQTASALTAAAGLADWMGDYANARALYEESLRIYGITDGGLSERYASTLHALGDLMIRTGDVDAGIERHETALEVRRKLYQAPHARLADSLHSLAAVRLGQDRHGEAFGLLSEALSMKERTRGPGHFETRSVRLTLAHVQNARGERQSAIALAEAVIASFTKDFGPDSVHLVNPLTLLGDARFALGQFEEAHRDQERAQKIFAETFEDFEDSHPRESDLLLASARTLRALKRPAEAVSAALSAASIAREELTLTTRVLPENQALIYAAIRRQPLALSLGQLVRAKEPQPQSFQRAWDELVRSRALVVDEMAVRHRLANLTTDAEVARIRDELAEARSILAHLRVRGVSTDDNELAALEIATRRQDELERELAEKSPTFGTSRAREALGLTEVLDALPADAALVAYGRYRGFDDPKDEGYLAFVASAAPRTIGLIDLGPAATIDAAVTAWRQEAGEGYLDAPDRKSALARYRQAGHALRQRIWDPLGKAVGETRRVFVVPEGNLALVNLQTLPTTKGRFLVESGPLIHLLSSERDLIRSADPAATGRGLLLAGGVNFNETSLFEGMKPEPDRIAASLPTDAGTAIRQASCRAFRNLNFEPLHQTLVEVSLIERLWKEDDDPEPVEKLVGGKASEESVKALTVGRRIVHLATHGFFLEGRCNAGLDDLDARGIGGLAPKKTDDPEIDNPLLLSGLVLAGANHRKHAQPGEEDGILTAEEVASLDLSGVEWAVLSACETGLGEVQTGEGVAGLRRAFRIAGARTVIMSLWPVVDESALDWMTQLYTRRLVDEMGTAEAVRQATLDVLEDRRKRGEPVHPFLWGGFVAAGDPR